MRLRLGQQTQVGSPQGLGPLPEVTCASSDGKAKMCRSLGGVPGPRRPLPGFDERHLPGCRSQN